jgi:hypothetical protein
MLYIGIDHKTERSKCALKLMKDKSQYEREIEARQLGNFDNRFVVNILQNYNGEEDIIYMKEFVRRGFENFHFCVVMPAGDRFTFYLIVNYFNV